MQGASWLSQTPTEFFHGLSYLALPTVRAGFALITHNSHLHASIDHPKLIAMDQPTITTRHNKAPMVHSVPPGKFAEGVLNLRISTDALLHHRHQMLSVFGR
jgi:hypothetical protein